MSQDRHSLQHKRIAISGNAFRLRSRVGHPPRLLFHGRLLNLPEADLACAAHTKNHQQQLFQLWPNPWTLQIMLEICYYLRIQIIRSTLRWQRIVLITFILEICCRILVPILIYYQGLEIEIVPPRSLGSIVAVRVQGPLPSGHDTVGFSLNGPNSKGPQLYGGRNFFHQGFFSPPVIGPLYSKPNASIPSIGPFLTKL